MFGSFISRTYPTIELCEFALLPKPSDIYYATCYTKTYFDTFQHLPSFADADEQTAKAVFEHLKTQMDLFIKEKPLLKNYRSIAYQNFMNEAMLNYNFDPAVDQKTLNIVMTKYHIK